MAYKLWVLKRVIVPVYCCAWVIRCTQISKVWSFSRCLILRTSSLCSQHLCQLFRQGHTKKRESASKVLIILWFCILSIYCISFFIGQQFDPKLQWNKEKRNELMCFFLLLVWSSRDIAWASCWSEMKSGVSKYFLPSGQQIIVYLSPPVTVCKTSVTSVVKQALCLSRWCNNCSYLYLIWSC